MSYRGDGGTVILSSGPDRRRSYRGAPATVAYRFSIRFSRAYRWWGSRALVGATGRMATSCIRSPSLREGGEDAYQGPIMPRGDAARNLVRPCGPDRPPPAGFRGSNTARLQLSGVSSPRRDVHPGRIRTPENPSTDGPPRETEPGSMRAMRGTILASRSAV